MTNLNDKIKEWWDRAPYTYGLASGESYTDVGDVDDAQIDSHFFDEYMRKTRKHFDDAQQPGEPTAARFIPYADLKGKKVLDIATGLGWAAVEMARAGADVTAIDLTPRAVALTTQHFAHRGLTGTIRQMDAQQLAFPDNTFDFVHAWGCLMHMPDTERAIREIYRVLKPGGTSHGYMYNQNSVTYWWNFFLLRGVLQGKLLAFRFDTTRLVSRYSDGSSRGGNMLTKVYTPRQAERMFEAAGFGTVKFSPWGPPQMIELFPVRRLPLGRALPYSARKAIADRFGWGMVYRAPKK